MQIRSAVTSDTVTVWWERDDGEPSGTAYDLRVNGVSRHVQSTHGTACHLSAGTKVSIEVYRGKTLLGRAETATLPEPEQLDVTAFGAVGDGQTLNTKAIQAAMDACQPGQEVVFPAGIYLTGALRLHSDMRICLQKDAVLQGTANPDDYLPKIRSRFEGLEMTCYQSLLNLGEMDHSSGPNCRNVLIHGEGTISGGGQPLALAIIEEEQERLKSVIEAMGDRIQEYENEHTLAGRARGRLINLSNCENVRITGLMLQNGASWNVHMLYSRDIVTDHCTFRSEEVWNGDGWDPDSSENCTLFASTFYTGDDSVAIKSGKNPEGNVINRPTGGIRIFDCRSEYGHGIAVGSEMSGGVSDVKIWDCDLRHSLYGVLIKGTRKRGGYVRDILVQNCRLPRFQVCAVKYNDDGEGASQPPVFENIRCEQVHFSGWARDYWETEMHPVPIAEISGFDVPGFEARNIRLLGCTAEGEAVTRLHCCRDIVIDITAAG